MRKKRKQRSPRYVNALRWPGCSCLIYRLCTIRITLHEPHTRTFLTKKIRAVVDNTYRNFFVENMFTAGALQIRIMEHSLYHAGTGRWTGAVCWLISDPVDIVLFLLVNLFICPPSHCKRGSGRVQVADCHKRNIIIAWLKLWWGHRPKILCQAPLRIQLDGMWSGEGLCPLHRKCLDFRYQDGGFLRILGGIIHYLDVRLCWAWRP